MKPARMSAARTGFPDRLEAVVFDLDGTLLDTAPEFVEAVRQLRAEHSLPPLPDTEVRRVVSDGARAMVALALNMSPDDEGFEPQRLRFLQIYEQGLGGATRPYPGIAGLIGELAERGIPWGVSTNKPSYLTDPLLQAVALQPPPGSVVCPDHVARPKPDPEPLLLNAAQLGADPANTVYVGDHRRDIEAGRAAGMYTVAAAYGYIHEPAEPATWGADGIAGSGEELAALVAAAFR